MTFHAVSRNRTLSWFMKGYGPAIPGLDPEMHDMFSVHPYLLVYRDRAIIPPSGPCLSNMFLLAEMFHEMCAENPLFFVSGNFF